MKAKNFKTKIKSNTLKIESSKTLISKDVELTIKEVEINKSKKRIWNFSASIDLKGKTDKINLRELAD